MAFLSQLGELWHRRPNLVHWTAVGAVALVALVLVAGTQGRARSAATAWGTPVRVLAASSPLAIGTSVDGNVDLVEVPAHLVPAGALTSTLDVGKVTRTVPRGGLLTELDVDPTSGVSGGRRGVGIGVSPHAPEVRPGTAVELLLFADIDPFQPADTSVGAERVRAHVLASAADRWFVEIDPADLESVARASATGVIVPVVLSAAQ
ncbi:hypothetical protein [Candidatus Poriferisodalis sp.]|uniref:hypothetical protein n=1 Tax=Candidatus Poriferisodalis sp. TaxID=3101277 RepID=UPI003B02CB1A